jgi:DNA-binding NarL/FixJ family response regulator
MIGKQTRILLADDHELVRRGLRTLLESQPGWEVCGEASNGRTAVEMSRRLLPDIVVMDVSMPELNGFEATRQILAKQPKVEVLALSMHESQQMVKEVLEAGARGYVLKSDAGSDLVAAVEALSRHGYFFSARLGATIKNLAQTVAAHSRKRPKVQGALTTREREILQLLAEGCTNKLVASRLGISVKTAETHRARIMRKLKVDSVADVVRYAIRNGLILP